MNELPETPKRRNPLLLAIGGLVLLAVLAGAAFLGGRYLNQQPAAGGGLGPETVIQGEGGEMMVQSSRAIEFSPAEELPQTSPAAHGTLTRREDNSLFIGTGNLSAMAKSNSDGSVDMETTYDGPVVEVVVTKDTQIYRDVTFSGDNAPTMDQVEVQQKVEPGELDEVSGDCMLIAWGRKVGDRVIADVLVYTLPIAIQVK